MLLCEILMENKSIQNEQVEHLVAQAQKGQSGAFAQIYDLFIDQIYKYIYYRAGAQEAEDLTEMVFLKTWENIRQYRAGCKGFSSWIFRIAHNVVIDFYRSHQTNGQLTESIKDERKEADARQRAHNHFDRKVLETAMMELKDAYRQILILKYINDLTNEEISRILGKSQAALRILQFRALRTLKKTLARMNIHGLE